MLDQRKAWLLERPDPLDVSHALVSGRLRGAVGLTHPGKPFYDKELTHVLQPTIRGVLLGSRPRPSCASDLLLRKVALDIGEHRLISPGFGAGLRFQTVSVTSKVETVDPSPTRGAGRCSPGSGHCP